MPNSNIDKKDLKKKRRRRKPRILYLFGIIAVAAGIYFLLTSQLFTIYNIKVEDNLRYSDYTVIDIAGVHVGDNLFKTGTGKAKKALLEDQYFDSIKISRKIPDTLVIKVTEKTGLLAVPFMGSYAIIDKMGTVLEMTDEIRGCTVLSGITLESGEPGHLAIPNEKNLFLNAFKLVESMEENNLFFIRMALTETTNELYIFDNLCYKGTTERLVENMDSIKPILYDLKQKEISRGVITVGSDGYTSFSPLTE